MLHCVYVPQFSYPFICWWTSRLLACPGYYKQCCDEHWSTRVSFNSGFLGVYAQQWNWIMNSGFDFSRVQTKTMDLISTEQESKEVAQSPSMNNISYFWKHGNPFNIGPLFHYVETLKMCCSSNRTTCLVPYHLQTVKMVPHISFFKAEYMWRQSLVTYLKNISKWKLHWGISGCARLCTISQVF